MNGEYTMGVAILAGGRGTRMGADKALLHIGEGTFLEQLTHEFASFPEMLLSVDKKERYPDALLQAVEDVYPGCGPMSGLLSALRACRSELLFCVPCDTPLVPKELAHFLAACLPQEAAACIPVTENGQPHFLCGVYRKSAAAALEAQIRGGNCKMRDAAALLHTKLIPLAYSVFSDQVLENINTPEDYAVLRKRLYGPPVIAISGVKNSGKTTLIEGILPHLAADGRKVAVIKHDGHDFTPDVSGTDSWRFREAGAYGVAVYSGSRSMLIRKEPDRTFSDFFSHFADADLILLEGGKFTAYPKLEVVRGTVSEVPVCDPTTLIGVCTDLALLLGVPRFGLTDYRCIAEHIWRSVSPVQSAHV